jgi:cyclomaltodextrinase / maltogenic alpha-amylase / neopullulanase
MGDIPVGIYQHYKGNYYTVAYVATHTETKEHFVIYKPVEGNRIWARPLEMFNEDVEVDGVMVPRFRKVRNQDITELLEEEE